MKKKTFIGIITALSILLFGISSFAANNMIQDAANGVRNAVGGAENAVEGAVTGIANGVREGISGVENTTSNVTSSTMKTNNSNYSSTRTATTRSATTNNNTFLGMGPIAWSWIIMAILGIATVALVWYYGKEHEENYNNNDNNY